MGILAKAPGALYDGATSLVDLIRRQFDGDIEGATQELVRQAGFPEPVARRIATGELPMDEASRLARASEQGYDTSRPVYHGTDTDFLEFDPERAVGSQFWSTTDKGAVEGREVGAAGHGVIKELYHGIQNPAGWEEYDKLFLDEIIGRGYDGLKLSDPDGHATMVAFDPKQYKSTDAAFDPRYTGPNIMGGAALPVAAGLLAAGQSDDADAGFVTRGGKTLLEAFHGSPHKFDKFSMDQIGTGEGVQQYGHGLYFADDIDTAKGFQPRDPDHEQWMYEQYKAAEDSGDQYMMDAWERAMMHDSPIELRASAADPDYDEQSQAAFAEVADALSANPGAGSLSRVEIDVTPESLLDYDKPLSEQSDLVQSFFAGRDGIGPDTSGRALSESLLGGREPGLSLKELNEISSKEMNEAGINGLQYQDWVNQASGSDIRNYVIFDDSLINIAERGNADPRLLAGTAAGTAGLLSAPALMKGGVFQHGATSEPVVERKEPVRNQAGWLEDVTDFGDEVFKSVRHAAGPLADVFMPYEGVNNYLKTVNDYDRQPTWWDRLGILDF